MQSIRAPVYPKTKNFTQQLPQSDSGKLTYGHRSPTRVRLPLSSNCNTPTILIMNIAVSPLNRKRYGRLNTVIKSYGDSVLLTRNLFSLLLPSAHRSSSFNHHVCPCSRNRRVYVAPQSLRPHSTITGFLHRLHSEHYYRYCPGPRQRCVDYFDTTIKPFSQYRL